MTQIIHYNVLQHGNITDPNFTKLVTLTSSALLQLPAAYWPTTTMSGYWRSCCEVAKPSPQLLRWCPPLKLHDLLAQCSCKILPLMSYYRTATMWELWREKMSASVALQQTPSKLSVLAFSFSFWVIAELLLRPSREARVLRSFSNPFPSHVKTHPATCPPK